MKEIGEALRTARESQNLTLEDIQEKTKIRKYYLQAIEEGNISALPGMVYAKGFIRNYAEHVGLDGHALLQEYGLTQDKAQAEPQAEPSITPEHIKTDTAAPIVARPRISSKPESNMLPQVVMGIVIIGLLGVGLWFLNNRNQADEPPSPPQAQQPVTPTQPAPTPAPQPAEPKPAEPLKAETITGSKSVYKVEGDKVKLELSAVNGDCWVEVKVDGQVKDSKIIPKGSTVTYEGTREVSVGAGFSPALAIKVNDRPVELEQAKQRHDYSFQKQ